MTIKQLISSGQAGVDRAALEAGRLTNIPLGGWVARGGVTEDHPAPPGIRPMYPELWDAPWGHSSRLMEMNVRHGSATLIVVRDLARLTRSVNQALTLCVKHDRPHYVTDMTDRPSVLDWLTELPTDTVLNVTGPWESEQPGIYVEAVVFLSSLLRELVAGDES